MPLLSSTALVSPPGMSWMRPSGSGGPSPAQGTHPGTCPAAPLRAPHDVEDRNGAGQSLPDAQRPSSSEHKRRALVLVAAINAAGAVSPGETSSGD